MSDIEQIEIGLKKLLKNVETSFIAKVVEDKTDTVDVADLNGTVYFDARKIATQGKLGFLYKLKKDSFVIVSRISNSNELFITMMSELDEIHIDCENIVFNKGNNKGLIKISELHSRLKKLESAFNSHKHAATGYNSTVISFTTVTGTSNEFQGNYSGYENSKIKH